MKALRLHALAAPRGGSGSGAARPPARRALEGGAGLLAIFIVAYTVIFAVALCAQALMLQWRPWFPGAEGEKSLLGGVKASVYTLMSHLI